MIIPRQIRAVIGSALVSSLAQIGHRVIGVSVSGMHSHILVELPDDLPLMKAIIGEAKRASSRAVKSEMPGRVWAAGGDFDPVDSREHQEAALNYILTRQGPGAWTWSYREGMPNVTVKVRAPRVDKSRQTRGGARPPGGGPRSAPA